MLICRILPIQCLCRICWCSEVRTLGEFSTPSSPLWRILGTLSIPGVANPPPQPNNTLNAAYRGPAPWHRGSDLVAHWLQAGWEPDECFRLARSSMTRDSWREYVTGFREWPDDWCGLCPRDLVGPALSVTLGCRTPINGRKFRSRRRAVL